ncbi:MAG: hypothetical protein FD169_845 [Bacillota bacterium]|nr:MAG: hypothetical protein FD169_845 [Bacillota bacterium]MBS3950105.1 hypothetical protein [Peptococcaceae bacterium]
MPSFSTFRPSGRLAQLLLSLGLCYGVLLYLLLILPPGSTLVISCMILVLFATVTLTMYHRSLAERRVSVGIFGVRIHRAKRFVHVPWSQISGVNEVWIGYGHQRHRRFYLITVNGEIIELMRDGEYAHPDQIIELIENYKIETARQ